MPPVTFRLDTVNQQQKLQQIRPDLLKMSWPEVNHTYAGLVEGWDSKGSAYATEHARAAIPKTAALPMSHLTPEISMVSTNKASLTTESSQTQGGTKI